MHSYLMNRLCHLDTVDFNDRAEPSKMLAMYRELEDYELAESCSQLNNLLMDIISSSHLMYIRIRDH